jgi:hypothetical protein
MQTITTVGLDIANSVFEEVQGSVSLRYLFETLSCHLLSLGWS